MNTIFKIYSQWCWKGEIQYMNIFKNRTWGESYKREKIDRKWTEACLHSRCEPSSVFYLPCLPSAVTVSVSPLPQHKRPISFLVQPWLQHFPATPREKFLFFLLGGGRSAGAEAAACCGDSSCGDNRCCLKRATRSASEERELRGEEISGSSAPGGQLCTSSSAVVSLGELHWKGSGGRGLHITLKCLIITCSWTFSTEITAIIRQI